MSIPMSRHETGRYPDNLNLQLSFCYSSQSATHLFSSCSSSPPFLSPAVEPNVAAEAEVLPLLLPPLRFLFAAPTSGGGAEDDEDIAPRPVSLSRVSP